MTARLWLVAAAGLLAAGAFAASGAGAAAPRSSWWREASIAVSVHEHAFRRVTANGVGCSVRVRLYFDAPGEGYRDPARERNHYRFQAQVRLADGRSIRSAVFDNLEPGARVRAFSHDTRTEGCWAEREHALRKVDVHACRGAGCVPEPFE